MLQPHRAAEAVARPADIRSIIQFYSIELSPMADGRLGSRWHAAWSRVGHAPEIPVTGERKSIKILGAIELWRARFHYRQDQVFNADT